MGGCCSKSFNDFSEGIKNLNTRHRYFIGSRKIFTISVDRRRMFGGHHVIVISNRRLKDITFELTFKGSMLNAVSGQEEAVAKVAIYDATDRSHLEQKGEVSCCLYGLADTAATILKSNKHYDLLDNNCQNFCSKFLAAYGLPSYATDKEIVHTVGGFIYKAAKLPIVGGIILNVASVLFQGSSRRS